MKRSTSKPVPSPGRADKYPPPLMRFLRGSVGSRSSNRGRSSRATSLFLRRKRTTSSSAIEAHQEPSSPKVTCIGQVRVRRSSNSKPALKKGNHHRKPTSSNAAAGGNTRFCYWAGKPPALCNSFHFNLCCLRRRQQRRPESMSFRPRWRKWVSFFRCRNIWVRTDSSKKVSNPTGSVTIDSDSDDEGKLEEEEEEGNNSSAGESFCRVYELPAPPKNALLLTRCRSAPHRSSYLTSRFWGSPLKTEEAKTGETGENRGSAAWEEEELGSLETEQKELSEESTFDPEDAAAEEEVEVDSDKLGKTATTTTTKKGGEGEKQRERGGSEGEELVVVLTRSKSEPASVWRERRLEFTSVSSSSTHSLENK